MKPKTRLVYLDFLRIVAILTVLYCHTGTGGYLLHTLSDSTLKQVVCIFISSFSRIGVPLFFMISGALLLNKEESFKDLFFKRILRFLIILIIFSTIRYLYQIPEEYEVFDLKELIRNISTGYIYTAYWFLYSYIGFLISLPILRKMAKIMESKDYIYLFVVYVLFASVTGSLARTFLGQINIVVPVATDIIVYPLMGYFIAHKVPEKYDTKKSLIGVILMGMLGLVLNVCVTMYDHYLFLGWNESGLLLFAMMPTVSVFYVAKYFFDHIKLPAVCENIICVLGSCAFGVYLLEWFIKDFTGPFWQKVLGTIFSGYYLNVIYIVFIMLTGMLITFILKKIPLIKKLF